MKTHRVCRLSLNPHRAVKQHVSVRPQTQVSSVSVCGSIRWEQHMSQLSQMGPRLGGNTLLTAGVHRGAQTHARTRAHTRRPCDETRARLSLALNLFTRWGCFHRLMRDRWVHQGEIGAQSNRKTSQTFFNCCALKTELIDLLKVQSRCSNGKKRKFINRIKKMLVSHWFNLAVSRMIMKTCP